MDKHIKTISSDFYTTWQRRRFNFAQQILGPDYIYRGI